ncbi:MAG: HAD hydrolase-like protein [Sediminibacterium sp.]|nr:HAD hydrolase-like protein [Sediminibacterium sp.]
MEQEPDGTQNKEMLITADTVLFFDMDGTLVDTNLSNFHSYKKAIRFVTNSDYDLTHNPEKRFNRSALKNVIPNLTEKEYEKIIQKKEKYYEDFLHENKLNKKISDILFKYSKTNKTVLVTNCRKGRALATLNYFGLTDKFAHIFYRQFANNDEKVNKFQYAISELGVSPNLVIAFENEEIEIADAKQAGIKIINPEIT